MKVPISRCIGPHNGCVSDFFGRRPFPKAEFIDKLSCLVVVLLLFVAVVLFLWARLSDRIENSTQAATDRQDAALQLVDEYMPKAALDDFAAARCTMRLDALRNNEAT